MDKLEKFLGFKLCQADEIPKIPLYMDQVTGYLDDIFKDVKRDEDEKILTKTMINNYVKAGLLKAPEKKKYNAEQIKTLMMIYMLKGSLQIQEIEKFLSIEEDHLALYEQFIETDKALRVELDKDRTSKAEKILELLLASSLQKRYAELLLDELYEEKE